MTRFIKLAADGTQLPPEATDHVSVLDTQLNLQWTAATLSEAPHGAATEAVAALDLGGHKDWRLPTAHELFSLVDLGRYRPAIDTGFFPGTKSDWYWTSSPVASDPEDVAWFVNFGYGGANFSLRDCHAFVRAVRSVSASPAGQ